MEILSAASSFFARSNISQSYNVTSSTSSRSSTPVSSGSSNSSPPAVLQIGLWKVQSAVHKVTGKRVSVWAFEKRSQELERLGPLAKERTLEVLKAEASALGRLRHPSILEMVEPLEETRSELTFATEPVLASLELAIGRYSSLVELDEIEIQAGVLAICKGLSFLHSSANLIHSNLSLESVIINSAGDWKISGLGLTIPLNSRWEFPTFDGRAPAYIQRSFDYMAPEYALSELLVTASDMYSLGVLIYAVHSKGGVPFKTHGSIATLRETSSANRRVPGMDSWDTDLQALLSSLLSTRHTSRPTPSALPSLSFFNSLPVSTLNFLDRSNFTSKTREEKVGFMKGLNSVLGRFSEGLQRRKLLPSLLEEMKDSSLLPYILPNIFTICTKLSPAQFGSTVLPALKPLFAIKDPPQNMLTLLDNLEMLRSKTEKSVFKAEVLPLVYNALSSEHAVVQERALNAVPDLCEHIDYAEVQGVLFPAVALCFSRTRILSVKVATLNTFLALVKTLDQTSLTQKLVPLLSKIRTKEPAVTMATLSVQEAMGFKVDREAVATLVLPQLWAMSMGPLLNVDQFQRFMVVIRKLGDRVEKEHNQFLRDSQRLEDRSATTNTPQQTGAGGPVDFQSLVGGKDTGANGKVTSNGTGNGTATANWEDDVWGSIFNEEMSPIPTPSLPASPKRDFAPPKPSRLGVKPPVTNNFNKSTTLSSYSKPSPVLSSTASPVLNRPISSVMQPSSSSSSMSSPNYNIALPPAPANNYFSTSTPPSMGQPAFPGPPMGFSTPPMGFSTTPVTTPPTISMQSILAPSKPATPNWGNQSKAQESDWGDFDPLK
ncbi:other/SCY1 protein kinase [Mycena floridula]|nr:other/SCY1 protein kinase [Mycena floridula]